MSTLEFVLPESSPDPCPNACGGLTEDPYGGPCKACWANARRTECPGDCLGRCRCDDGWEDA